MSATNYRETDIELIRAKELTKMLRIGKATLWRWANTGHRNFPAPIRLGPGVAAWRKSDVDLWLRQVEENNT